MEVDSVHSVIENKPMYSPQSYFDAITEYRSSQPYNVKYVFHEFFMVLANFWIVSWLKSSVNEKPIKGPKRTNICKYVCLY